MAGRGPPAPGHIFSCKCVHADKILQGYPPLRRHPEASYPVMRRLAQNLCAACKGLAQVGLSTTGGICYIGPDRTTASFLPDAMR